MSDYVVELLGEDGSVLRTLSFSCADDDEAIDLTGEVRHPHAMVVRQGDRHVATFAAPAPLPGQPSPL